MVLTAESELLNSLSVRANTPWLVCFLLTHGKVKSEGFSRPIPKGSRVILRRELKMKREKKKGEKHATYFSSGVGLESGKVEAAYSEKSASPPTLLSLVPLPLSEVARNIVTGSMFSPNLSSSRLKCLLIHLHSKGENLY